ncbi:GntR family transcriptional regulator [Salinisphaera sp. SPP-AMP-43]|uniref:GntR family transcriptional regulator n=1 Tax=Salinisphaera sp. SPP-AMP-43 TaxID=3121288 RepID=UPI003C6E9DBA
MEEIRQRIATGQLKPGDKLASIRAEAAALGGAKNTVVEAYFRLAAQRKPWSVPYYLLAPKTLLGNT